MTPFRGEYFSGFLFRPFYAKPQPRCLPLSCSSFWLPSPALLLASFVSFLPVFLLTHVCAASDLPLDSFFYSFFFPFLTLSRFIVLASPEVERAVLAVFSFPNASQPDRRCFRSCKFPTAHPHKWAPLPIPYGLGGPPPSVLLFFFMFFCTPPLCTTFLSPLHPATPGSFPCPSFSFPLSQIYIYPQLT